VRVAATLGILLLGLVGCLFPSLDGLEGNPSAATAPSASTSGSKPDASVPEAGPPSPPLVVVYEKGTIACGSTTCVVGSEVCCAPLIGTPTCNTGKPPGCLLTIGCDEGGDCPDGQFCCHIDQTRTQCQADCGPGDTICNPSAQDCQPAAPHCSLTVPASQPVNVCQ
jgi:hypothetical protein